MYFLIPQTAISIRYRESAKVPPGSKGVASMQGSSSVPGRSVHLWNNSKAKRSLANGVRSTGVQKSDYLIVVMKSVKADGAKGIANQQSPEAKHVEYRRLRKHGT